ncbi:helix-turn-helix domain-containing protein [Chitinophagaceae bacterium LB-8]|uniref:Helix-turn-helix domain-containing protein n=1 Tax=Paraflavisolibacter caeni TaxID=2982496 RepID=A0A9X2XZ40_9BACT|nr:helix-turn-helix domain-containing protein [Paraflavisolibacter caeni]MCU7551327.1 helix-turn-helix domain-containing protein [Paraflavisolibacter caeni]
MDNTCELIEGSFGLYSSVNTKKQVGPVKTEYYRLGLVRSGSSICTNGLETFQLNRNFIVFGLPGQVLSLQILSDDYLAYYMYFSESFIAEMLLLTNYRGQFPFLSHAGVQCFPLSEEEGNEVESIILKINDEVKARKSYFSQAIRLYIQHIYIIASRSYNHKVQLKQSSGDVGFSLFTRYIRLVSEHFLTTRKVSDYARMLHVSADHLNRSIKVHSDKTAHELIDEMIFIEAKAYLMHSMLSIAEIAYKLGFSNPSNFNKFFKKLANCTPLKYRNKSE